MAAHILIPDGHREGIRRTRTWFLSTVLAVLLASILFSLLWVSVGQDTLEMVTQSQKTSISVEAGGAHFPTTINMPTEGETGPKVIAMVFYGRLEYVQILDCYLKRNLKDNGGLIDEVVWVNNPRREEDSVFLESLVQSHTTYRVFEPPAPSKPFYMEFSRLWNAVEDKDAIYIKIDDDVVYIEDTTIPSLVSRLVENPRNFLVSANVINMPALSWRHFSMNLFEIFWPEMEPPSADNISSSWRPSTLPSYTGPPEGPVGFTADGQTPAPFKGHRWLPVRASEEMNWMKMMHTPAGTIGWNIHGPAATNWAATAQLHYSFLTHLERGDVAEKFRFDYWGDLSKYTRLSVNLVAVWGRDVLDAMPFPTIDDERYLAQTRPAELGRNVVVDGGGTAVHFAFWPQYSAHDGRGMTWTDVLSRYRGYANEFVCPAVGGMVLPKASFGE